MRYLLTLLFLFSLCTCVRAQVGGSVDAEYASWCMVDSIAPGNVVRFSRLINVATLEVVDVNPVAGTTYTVVGTLLTCEAYDLAEAIRDPLADLYEDCQCEYSIGQENHRVSEIRGGITQEWDVEYQEVVRRRCAGQMASVVVHRDTLFQTESISPSVRLQFGWSFTAPGQYVDQVNLRYYTSSNATNTISIDLNPATVTTSYPGLGLDPDDFEFDGSNLEDLAASYQAVLDDQVTGTTNAVTTLATATTVSIFTQFLHEPNFPYVTQPRPGDADYLVQATTPNGIVVLGSQGLGATTSTTNYSEECEEIFTTEYGSYLIYSQDTPLEFRIELNVATTLQAQNSNESAFCNVSPAVCAELAPDPVTFGGECIETCSDVLNLAGHLPIVDVDTTLQANEFNSISIYVTQGPVGVILNGQRINYPAGWSTLWSAAPGKLLSNSIGLSAIGGEAIISYVR